MTDEKPKRRPWLQLHLSTCVVLMVVAGSLVWANLIVRHTETYRRQVEAMNALPDMLGVLVDGSTTDPFHLWGFPFVAYSKGHGYFYTPRFHPWGIAGNIFVGLAFLLATALTCELVIHRRARNRQDPVP